MAAKLVCWSLIVVLNLYCLLRVSAAARVNNDDLRLLFDCPECPPMCPSLPRSFQCEPVMEPGVCSCCPQCARAEGDLCGLRTGRCAKGLSCRPLPGDPDPFRSLMDGKAICTPESLLW
ncbi:insulin-like growth factor binding protein-5 [Elysia marginata]|uniref:Insulin-like growth factor binding protein-5 n=1 Tax=Elysia marginata TaxID=1093978 RepID=A0AAV4FQY3_9GAST|nr:insulin-like growth factor binding protein-5 [Elysia marginata]